MTQSAIPSVGEFLFAGETCGIKASGAPDLGLIFVPSGAVSAGVYTRNEVRAAPDDYRL